MDNDQPIIASRKPFYKELKAGQRVLWCSCGRSKRQPFCDGRSHVGTGFEPVQYQAQQDEEVLFCGCKHTCTAPFCDGAHSNLPGGYGSFTPDTISELLLVESDEAGFARLDGECYVVTPQISDDLDYALTTLVSPALGARHQAQFHMRLAAGKSPVLTSDAGDVVLWVRVGQGKVVIGGRSFACDADTGVSIRKGETFQIECTGAALDVYVSVCPGTDSLDVREAMADAFDEDWPVRTVAIDQDGRQAMGPRWFQTLVDERHGLRNTAQFVGHIPLSHAEMHRHLYEEALIILSGRGKIWNETRQAHVKAGDVIFFPRKHVHSLQCVAQEGMDVVGLIHPGTNPGINY
ncbi:cupin domain-containing protein [Novosphingobium sp. BL-52-GroH]|uniref:cupin domain-containing protein n=1 Tax=Novosphingobium sp. BL-52-GroH TaxID=3349877 RepID=UPI00384B48F5